MLTLSQMVGILERSVLHLVQQHRHMSLVRWQRGQVAKAEYATQAGHEQYVGVGIEGDMTEHAEQVALFQWAKLMETQQPDLQWLYAIPNGGHRHKAVAAKMKAEGVKAGVLDVCLPVARGCWHGLYIEMKYGRNKPTPAQVRWIDGLSQQGYYVDVCYSAERAIEVVSEYLVLEVFTKENSNGHA